MWCFHASKMIRKTLERKSQFNLGQVSQPIELTATKEKRKPLTFGCSKERHWRKVAGVLWVGALKQNTYSCVQSYQCHKGYAPSLALDPRWYFFSLPLFLVLGVSRISLVYQWCLLCQGFLMVSPFKLHAKRLQKESTQCLFATSVQKAYVHIYLITVAAHSHWSNLIFCQYYDKVFAPIK